MDVEQQPDRAGTEQNGERIARLRGLGFDAVVGLLPWRILVALGLERRAGCL